MFVLLNQSIYFHSIYFTFYQRSNKNKTFWNLQENKGDTSWIQVVYTVTIIQIITKLRRHGYIDSLDPDMPEKKKDRELHRTVTEQQVQNGHNSGRLILSMGRLPNIVTTKPFPISRSTQAPRLKQVNLLYDCNNLVYRIPIMWSSYLVLLFSRQPDINLFILWLLDKIVDKQRQIYESGIWTCVLWIEVPALYQLNSLALYWRFPYFANIFVQGGGGEGRKSDVVQPYTAL